MTITDTMAAPSVSVIVATFDWSAALRCALISVLRQTMRDFEVLVVGDGCSDDSGDVVAALQDPRLCWHNLERNHGSQWGPNNHGLQTARGIWIAYLGHDDIWHPEHLASLVSAIDQAPEAIGAAAGLLMYGAPGTGTVQIAGFLEAGAMQPGDFVPPSALLHRRDVIGQIGAWADADLIALPTDCDFEARLVAHGCVVTTGALTAFKFNAAARRDAYRRKSVTEQQAMLDAMEADPEIRQRELSRALVAISAGKLAAITMPNVEGRAPGAISRDNRRFKGVESRFEPDEMLRADTPLRFTLDRVWGAYEWHALEREGERTFRWSGPLTDSVLDLPVVPDRGLAISIGLHFVAAPHLLDTMKILLDGELVAHQIVPGHGDAIDTIEVAGRPRGDHLQLEFRLERTLRPIDLGHGTDTRRLGIALAWVGVAPLPAGDPRGAAL